jgi:hypothetical protein
LEVRFGAVVRRGKALYLATLGDLVQKSIEASMRVEMRMGSVPGEPWNSKTPTACGPELGRGARWRWVVRALEVAEG